MIIWRWWATDVVRRRPNRGTNDLIAAYLTLDNLWPLLWPDLACHGFLLGCSCSSNTPSGAIVSFTCYRNLFKMAFRLIPSLFLGNLSLPEFRHPRRHLLVHRANLHCVPWLLARDSGLRYGQHNSYMLFAMFLTFMAGMQRSRYRGADSCR